MKDILVNFIVFKNCGLPEHIKELTHDQGHILDLVISKGSTIYTVRVLLNHDCYDCYRGPTH